jgi:2-polyprenyl-3-methyl-5-hydroxy-6-metoxy-1,4-benzoquinol methylase
MSGGRYLRCGSGRAINTMAAAFPASRFTGCDFSNEAIENARAEAERMETKNAEFEVQDVSDFHRPLEYQLITAFDAIHDQAHPRKVLRNIADGLTPDGVFLMQDICASSFLDRNLDHPLAPLLYTVSCMHCMTVSLADGGEGLGTMWGEEKARELLAEAGFRVVQVHQLSHDIQNSFYVARKEGPASDNSNGSHGHTTGLIGARIHI